MSQPVRRGRFLFAMTPAALAAFLGRLGARPGACVLSIANNHIADQGPEGLQETITQLGALGAQAVGAMTDPRVDVNVWDIRGMRVGLVAWTRWLNCPALLDPASVWRTPDVAARDWERLRREAALDCPVGLPHWEYEFQHFPRAETRALARSLCHAGFDLIVGSHPHVIQPIEWLRPGVCFYSVGNLYSRMWSWPTRLSAAFEAELSVDGPERGVVTCYATHLIVQRTAGERTSLELLAADRGLPDAGGFLRRAERLLPGIDERSAASALPA